MKNWWIIIFLFLGCNQEQVSVDLLVKKVIVDFQKKIQYDPFVVDYFSSIAPGGSPNYYWSDSLCANTRLGKFIAQPLHAASGTWLLEEGGNLGELEPMTNFGNVLLSTAIGEKGVLSEYFASGDTMGCFMSFRVPLVSKERYWIELDFCTRISPERLSLLLIYDKSLRLKHMFRKMENALTYDACNLNEQQLLWNYEYPNGYWVGNVYFTAKMTDSLPGLE